MNKALQKPKMMNGVLLSFLIGVAGSFAIFLPFLVVDRGFFTYVGDYNMQQIPFYMYVQQFIKDGGGTWSWQTDLGSSVINAYSFYNIGSPFLWITMPFPSRWMPFLMAPLFMLKFGCIAASANLYLSRYAKTRNMAVIASVLYAFCGFNIYNIFFNHMLDAVVFFPLILWAMDGFIYEKRRGWLAVVIGLALLNSYFFFIGNVVFVLLYFLVKLILGEYKIRLSDFGFLALEALLGVGIGMALALPSFLSLLGNPRISSRDYGMDLLLYNHVHQYVNIISSLFLPPDPPYIPNLFTEGSIKWTSMSAFLPIVTISGVIAYWKKREKSSIKALLGISLLMALVPFFNSAFYAFNSAYYARWYYMPLLFMCFATMRSLEDADLDLEAGAKTTLVLTGAYIVFGLVPTRGEGAEIVTGAAKSAPKFWLTYLTAMLGAGIFFVLVKYFRKKARFAPILLSAVLGFSVFYSVAHLSLGKFPWYEHNLSFRPQMYDGGAEIDLPDEGFFRTDTYEMEANFSLWSGVPSLQTFNSTVTPSIMEFYPFVGVTRDVNSKPTMEDFSLKGLLSVEYMILPVEKKEAFETGYLQQGWSFYQQTKNLLVYKNEHFVPLGFTYDNYMTIENLEKADEANRSFLMMRSIGLNEDQAAEYGHLFASEITPTGTQEDASVFEAVNFDSYVELCNQRRASASYEVTADSSGFTSRIRLDRENLVFFSVPYDEGFSVTVNGEPREILRVSSGMMAVHCQAGDNELVFKYETPGLMLGASFTVLSLSLLCLYLVLFMYFEQKNSRKPKGQEKAKTGSKGKKDKKK